MCRTVRVSEVELLGLAMGGGVRVVVVVVRMRTMMIGVARRRVILMLRMQVRESG